MCRKYPRRCTRRAQIQHTLRGPPGPREKKHPLFSHRSAAHCRVDDVYTSLSSFQTRLFQSSSSRGITIDNLSAVAPFTNFSRVSFSLSTRSLKSESFDSRQSVFRFAHRLQHGQDSTHHIGDGGSEAVDCGVALQWVGDQGHPHYSLSLSLPTPASVLSSASSRPPDFPSLLARQPLHAPMWYPGKNLLVFCTTPTALVSRWSAICQPHVGRVHASNQIAHYPWASQWWRNFHLWSLLSHPLTTYSPCCHFTKTGKVPLPSVPSCSCSSLTGPLFFAIGSGRRVAVQFLGKAWEEGDVAVRALKTICRRLQVSSSLARYSQANASPRERTRMKQEQRSKQAVRRTRMLRATRAEPAPGKPTTQRQGRTRSYPPCYGSHGPARRKGRPASPRSSWDIRALLPASKKSDCCAFKCGRREQPWECWALVCATQATQGWLEPKCLWMWTQNMWEVKLHTIPWRTYVTRAASVERVFTT